MSVFPIEIEFAFKCIFFSNEIEYRLHSSVNVRKLNEFNEIMSLQ